MAVATTTVPTSSTPTRQTHKGFLSSPFNDCVFLIGAPILAIFVFVPFGLSTTLSQPFPDLYFRESLRNGVLHVVIFSHLVIVIFRSHMNGQIFRLYPFRFVGVPLLLFAGLMTSSWLTVAVSVLAVWWDVYHSALQTFGIGRIYDMKAGNDLQVGRRLDYLMNILIYAGPILAGASLMAHMGAFKDFAAVGTAFFARVPAYAESNARYLTWAVVAVAALFVPYYLHGYRKLAREGYQVSMQKTALYVITAAVSIFCWGFNSFGEAFFVMNFFHAWQYFFIVWHTEGDNITGKFGLRRVPEGRYIALAVFILFAVSFGIWTTDAWPWPALRFTPQTMTAVALVVSIMHFWYDGFIWSVRKGQVK